MKILLTISLAILLACACGGGPTALVPVASQTNTTEGQTITIERPTANVDTLTETRLPTKIKIVSTLTDTPEPTWTTTPCNPVETFCITTMIYPLARPIAAPGTVSIDRGYPYGSTEWNTREPHHGVEFNNASGTPVHAAADGVVVAAGDDAQKVFAAYPNTYGNLVVLEHHFQPLGQTIYTLYGHLSQVQVRIGQSVHQGDEIGLVGSTGAAIGSHLHFEVREAHDDYDSTRNPVLWLQPLKTAAGESEGIISGRLEDSQENPVYTDGINIQFFPDPKGAQAMAWQVETYAPDPHPLNGSDLFHENFALPDLPSGNYRVSFIWRGRLIERWIFVSPGCVTDLTIRLDP